MLEAEFFIRGDTYVYDAVKEELIKDGVIGNF
jgi:hypothetical protein